MIKGVNKRIVEVSLPGSEFFEKALVFLRSEEGVKLFPDNSPALEEEARRALSEADIDDVSNKRRAGKRLVSAGVWAAVIFKAVWRGAVIVCAGYLVWSAVLGGGVTLP